MTKEKQFTKQTEYRETNRGFEIKCKRGLFHVCAPTEEQAMSEAWSQFEYCWENGEYTTEGM